jgi:cation transport regulator ChaC
VRRFWQGSVDHRGVPGAPGRVVTLVEDAEGFVAGVCYRVPAADESAVLARLDHREKGGYERRHVVVETAAGGVDALLYAATKRNPNYLGAAPVHAIAAQIAGAAGPSGPNLEYVLELAQALDALGEEDEHVAAIVRHLT